MLVAERAHDPLEPGHAGRVEAAAGLVEQEQLRRRIHRLGEQHPAQLAARERSEPAILEPPEAHPLEQRPHDGPRRLRHAQAHREPLAGQRQELGHRHRQRGVDGEALRHVPEAAAPAEVAARGAGERRLPQERLQEAALPTAVGADHEMERPRLYPQRHPIEDGAPLAPDGEALDLDQRQLGHGAGGAAGSEAAGFAVSAGAPAGSCVSAATSVSAFFFISFSNLSAVYSPEAMCVMM